MDFQLLLGLLELTALTSIPFFQLANGLLTNLRASVGSIPPQNQFDFMAFIEHFKSLELPELT